MSNTDEHAVVVEGLTKRYGGLVAVNGISFTVRRGEVFAFLGPNGAGKSTTVEIIETVRTATAGRVLVLGMDVATRKRDIVPRIGVLPQGFSSFDRLTVAESLRYYARLFGRAAADIDGLMALTNLHEQRDVLFKNLSGGLQQRLGIAIALVNDPEVVFLDEPTTGLDPHARRAVWDVLLGLKRRGKTVFLTTHYMEEAELLADTVAVISKGRVVAVGSPDALIEGHATSLTLTLKAVDQRVIAALRPLNMDIAVNEGGNATMRVRNADGVLDILDAIKGAGVPLPSVDVRRANLEEVYLSLTGAALRDEPATTAGHSAPNTHGAAA